MHERHSGWVNWVINRKMVILPIRTMIRTECFQKACVRQHFYSFKFSIFVTRPNVRVPRVLHNCWALRKTIDRKVRKCDKSRNCSHIRFSPCREITFVSLLCCALKSLQNDFEVHFFKLWLLNELRSCSIFMPKCLLWTGLPCLEYIMSRHTYWGEGSFLHIFARKIFLLSFGNYHW